MNSIPLVDGDTFGPYPDSKGRGLASDCNKGFERVAKSRLKDGAGLINITNHTRAQAVNPCRLVAGTN